MTKAADLGDGFACEVAGNMIGQGLGCEADVEKAVYYLKKRCQTDRKQHRNLSICIVRMVGNYRMKSMRTV